MYEKFSSLNCSEGHLQKGKSVTSWYRGVQKSNCYMYNVYAECICRYRYHRSNVHSRWVSWICLQAVIRLQNACAPRVALFLLLSRCNFVPSPCLRIRSLRTDRQQIPLVSLSFDSGAQFVFDRQAGVPRPQISYDSFPRKSVFLFASVQSFQLFSMGLPVRSCLFIVATNLLIAGYFLSTCRKNYDNYGNVQPTVLQIR